MRLSRIIVAVPVGVPDTCDEFLGDVDEVICAITPEPYQGRQPIVRGLFPNERRRGARLARKTLGYEWTLYLA